MTKAEQTLKAMNLPYEWGVSPDNEVEVEVCWGDWKHDHGYLDYVMGKKGFEKINEVVTEEDGSDCYSAIHTYRYKG